MPATPVYLVDGRRTPFLRARETAGPFTAADLAVHAGKSVLLEFGLPASAIDEVIVGCVMPSPNETNIARIIALRLGLPLSVPAFTVQRNCASGLQAIDSAVMSIQTGRSHIVLCGGTEAMSHAPLLFSPELTAFLGKLRSAKTIGKKLSLAMTLRPQFFAPVVGLLRGLTDPVVHLNMGQTAEKLAYEWQISRSDMDLFAFHSHEKAKLARDLLLEQEITPLYGHHGECLTYDDGVRDGISLEKLSELKPVFDKPFGCVTAGNSSQITDGAAMLIVASEQAVKQYNLTPLALIKGCAWSGLDPSVMGLGPSYAIAKLVQEHHIKLDEIDRFEINEAFAVQVLACLSALDNADFCKNKLGMKHTVGKIPLEKLNAEGGAISMGHPVGASGARLSLHLAKMLQYSNQKRGIASLCIGGGQGGALYLERA